MADRMPTEILMPALSPTMTEGRLARWLKQPGECIRAGDVIAEIETDKATMEVEAVDDGRLARILVDEGTDGVAVNTPIALLESEDGPACGEPVRGAPALPRVAAEGESEAAIASRGEAARPPAQAVKPEPEAGATRPMTVREALRDTLAACLREDPDVFLMGEEVAQYEGAYKISQGLLEEFGERRVIDMPITEHGFAGLAVGAAFAGLRPVVEFMTFNFAMQAIDHIINSAAKTRYMSGGQLSCPIVFRGPNGAASRVAAQHSQDYASWYAHCPGLKVVAPYSAADARGLLRAAVRDPDPVIVLENELLYGQSFDTPVAADFILPIGRARIERPGTQVTIVAHSIMVGVALRAAVLLAEAGIDAEVINLRSLRPLDTETIVASVRRTGRLVSVEEGWPTAGIGAEVAMRVIEHAFDWLDAPPARVCAADVPLPYAANLEAAALPRAEQVVDAVRRLF